MKISEIIVEAFPFEPGTSTNPKIIDLRNPGPNRTHWVSGRHSPEIMAKYGFASDRFRYKDEKKRTHVILTKDGGAILYYYGKGNRVEWAELLNIAQTNMDETIQSSVFDISVVRNGYLISRTGDKNWSGDRNRYSHNVRDIAKRLVDLGLAVTTTPLWLGNWAAGQGESIGSIGRVLAKPTIPARLILYHGTSTHRLPIIMRDGLVAMPHELRVWNNRSEFANRPEHREDSVYLTASRPQAEYYASKAANKDRLWKNQRKVYDQFGRDVWKGTNPAYMHDKTKTALLAVTLYPRNYQFLMADDDFLRQNPDADPKDWITSLSQFGQIAFQGTIPPTQLKVIDVGFGRNAR